MRPALLLTLLLAGCSCGSSHTRDGGSVPLDGEPSDGGDAGLGDAALDGGRADCDEYARALCASADRCYRETIWFFGSIERCEIHFRAECEYERSLEDVGDRATAVLECYEEHRDCEIYRGEVDCSLPAGTRGEGAPCRSSFQCAEGLWCAGTESSFQGGPVGCDTGTCRAPLAEGATDCRMRADGNVCADGLRCVELEGGTRCAAQEAPGIGEPCGLGYECAEGLYCRSYRTCEPVLANGAACDPSEPEINFMGPCGGDWTFACDSETRTCVQFERAFEGERCRDGGPRCAGACVDGVCTATTLPPFGAPCESHADCGIYACVEGVCAPEPCD